MVSENVNWNGMANDFPSHVFLCRRHIGEDNGKKREEKIYVTSSSKNTNYKQALMTSKFAEDCDEVA